MTQIQIPLPLLIKEKITNYLDFTTWREKITKICQEYHQYYTAYCKFNNDYVVFISDAILKIYNYRKLTDMNYKNTNNKIHNLEKSNIAEISPNY